MQTFHGGINRTNKAALCLLSLLIHQTLAYKKYCALRKAMRAKKGLRGFLSITEVTCAMLQLVGLAGTRLEVFLSGHREFFGCASASGFKLGVLLCRICHCHSSQLSLVQDTFGSGAKWQSFQSYEIWGALGYPTFFKTNSAHQKAKSHCRKIRKLSNLWHKFLQTTWI